MVDYLEADRAFSLTRLASPYNLEGMDIYSTVLYVSSKILRFFILGFYINATLYNLFKATCGFIMFRKVLKVIDSINEKKK